MRPGRSFLFLFILLASLVGLFFVLPDSGLFPSPDGLLPDILNRYLAHQELADNELPPAVPADSPIGKIAGSGTKPDSAGRIAGYESNKLPETLIDSLKKAKGQVRILYYGDSQIEGDRVTYYLRKALREGREGTGPGLFLPVMPVMYTKSLSLKASSNWKRYNYLSYKSGKISHNKLGPFMSFCRYLPEGTTSGSAERAEVEIRPSVFADSATSVFELLRVFYNNKTGKVLLSVKDKGRIIYTDSLRNGYGVRELSCRLGGATMITIGFEGRVSPDIYGLSIESKTGIILDNIPQRGSAGLEFTMVDRKNLEESYNLLSPDLIILHYGLNIVKNVRNDYSYYKAGLSRQLSRLKEVTPLTPLLVIGVTDMAENDGDSVVSYRNIPSIIKVQEDAAREAGATFWNSYNAMGGKSSVVRWGRMIPPLAQDDYVHFTYPGADTLSRMLAAALFHPEETGVLPDTSLRGTPDTAIYRLPGTITPLSSRVKKPARVLAEKIFSFDPGKPFIFSTAAFWFFLLVVMAVYSLVYRRLFIRNFYLLLVSLFFYYKSGGLFLSLLILVTLIDFTCGIMISRSGTRMIKRLFILLSIISNILILAYFKYTGFFVDIINDVLATDIKVYDYLASFSNFHLGTRFDVSNIVLPVGISFFTFQSLSYTIDVYRGRLHPVRSIIDFGFFVSFFPQLVAGPIVRASEFIPQIYKEFNLTKREFSHSLFLISKGLIKKIVISDFIATSFIDRVFDLPAVYSGFENLMAVYGYGLQIYCDFSGYTDIAIGIGLIMGFRLPLNFNSPYKASSVADFWKRWHISLSRWLKDYLYIPLGGNRRGTIRTGINLMITMLLGGLWHGASLSYITWGGLHGAGLIANKIRDSFFSRGPRKRIFQRAIAVFITFNFVSFCWIFFRAPDINSAILMIRQIGENFSPGSVMPLLSAYGSVFLLIIIGYLIHLLPEKVKESYRGLFIGMPMILQAVIILMSAVLILGMRTGDIVPFIYFRF
jgi:D-alanyl-lipoteichoic acid acyltransferase DltB (MBOAT superfamily)